MRRLLVVLALFLVFAALSPVWANVCTCNSACLLNSGSNWSGNASCTTSGPTQTTDAIVIASGGSLLWAISGTRVYQYLWIQPGGSVTVTTSPVVMQFNGTVTVFAGVPSFFVVGAPNDSRGTFTSDGKDLTISWTGAGAGISMNLGPQPFGGQNDPNDRNTAITMRGVERVVTAVASIVHADSTPPDTSNIDCIKGLVAPTGATIGDTIVFTSGRSRDFWYKVSGIGVTATCTAALCGGSNCDVEVTRSATDATPGSVASSNSWNSMTKVGTNGGFTALRHKTPDDNDADGTANGDGLWPAVGDSYVIFKPVLIQGKTNPLTGGIQVHINEAGINWRYVELNKLSGQLELNSDCVGAGNPTSCCTGVGTGTCSCGGIYRRAGIWDTEAKMTAPEGEIGFLNYHNFSSGQGAWEGSLTSRPSAPARPNANRTFTHVYLHDVDATVGTTCPGEGYTDVGSGITFFCDQAEGFLNKVTLNGFHAARWGSGPAVATTDSCTSGMYIDINDMIIDNAPGIAGYAPSVHGIDLYARGLTNINGLAMWDLGADATHQGVGLASLSSTPVAYDVRNAFVVNIDSGVDGGQSNDFAGGAFVQNEGSSTVDSSPHVISNSYIAKIYGHAVEAGRTLFSFIKDTNMEVDGAAPCTAGNRGAIRDPVEVTGSVVTRSNALSCMADAVVIGGNAAATSNFTTRTRRIVSNVFHNFANDIASARTSGITVIANASIGIDVYNNVIDGNGATVNRTMGFENVFVTPTPPYKFTAFYNVIVGMPDVNGGGFAFDGFTSQYTDEGYNRFIQLAQSPACNNGCATSDTDSDIQDFFTDRPNFRLGQLCTSPDKTRNPWGGPVGPLRFGIQGFERFHPSVLPLMDADAFKRYDWRECGRSYQDTVYR